LLKIFLTNLKKNHLFYEYFLYLYFIFCILFFIFYLPLFFIKIAATQQKNIVPTNTLILVFLDNLSEHELVLSVLLLFLSVCVCVLEILEIFCILFELDEFDEICDVVGVVFEKFEVQFPFVHEFIL